MLPRVKFAFVLSVGLWAQPAVRDPGPAPHPPAAAIRGLIGDYVHDKETVHLAERQGRLWLVRDQPKSESALARQGRDNWTAGRQTVRVERLADSPSAIHIADIRYVRQDYPDVARIAPLRPIPDLRAEALAAQPPVEKGDFRQPDLVELRTLDPAIRYDIRYATTNNFLGARIYADAAAQLQRPAAEALLRAHRKLRARGFGLLIHDAYRPWYATRIFWDATPPDKRDFVADPAKGSRHNRGCAVDLTLYDLRTGRPAEMTGAYDEMSGRSFPDYPGGSSVQRWHRDLLRWAMEAEGFTVYPFEWWHFDYKDWERYPILNLVEDLVR